VEHECSGGRVRRRAAAATMRSCARHASSCPTRGLFRPFRPSAPWVSLGPPPLYSFFLVRLFIVRYGPMRAQWIAHRSSRSTTFDFSKLDGPQIRGSSETYSWARTLSYGRNRRIITIPGSFAVDVTPFAVRCSIKSRMMVRDLGYPSAPPLLDQCCAHLQCTLELSLRQPV
jgi:hypothetical protein